jgi:hypothetical protein
MKRISIVTLAVLALSFTATTLRAQNPHFQRCSSSGPDSAGSLQACFRITGLGQTPTTVTASSAATAVWGCQTNGGQCPNAANKVSSSGTVSAQGTFTPDKNGNASGCLSLTPPPPPSSFKGCPGGQTLVLVSVSYGNVTLSAPGTTCTTGGGSANYFPNCP